jgi:hypothetical protein
MTRSAMPQGIQAANRGKQENSKPGEEVNHQDSEKSVPRSTSRAKQRSFRETGAILYLGTIATAGSRHVP